MLNSQRSARLLSKFGQMNSKP
jgi:hypothetical protein